MEKTDQCICYNCFRERESQEGSCPYCGFDLAENEKKYPLALRAGSILNNRYLVGRVLGQGGFGITYLAFDTQLNAKVAIKEYMPGEMATRIGGTTVSVMSADRSEDFSYGEERFQEEARTLAKFIGNPNIAAVTSYFHENDTCYFVMDYVEGISLKNYIAEQGGRISVEETLNVMIPVLRALTAVHAEGFIHRDVTPDNIYITKDGIVKLLDFGSARYSIGDKSKSLDVILKVGYAPKEQYIRRSRQGGYTDVYSCAACFYGALTGYLPPEALERLEKDELVPVSQCGVDIPEWLDKAILKGLAVQPEDRFQNAQEFLDVIEQQQVVEVAQAGAAAASSEKERKRRPLFLAGAAAVLAVAVLGGVWMGGRRGGAGLETTDAPAGAAEQERAAAETEAVDVIIGGETYSTALTELDLSDMGLTNQDLAALGQMQNLTTLSLKNNYEITDLSPLSGLTALESLNLYNTGAVDLSPLSSLKNLTELRLANAEISDLSPLASLTKLKILYLDDGDLAGSQILDLSPLSGLSELETLCIPSTPNYTDFSFMENLTQLRRFKMMGTHRSDSNSVQGLDFLRNLTKLEELSMVIQGGDLECLAGMTQLRSVKLDGDFYADSTAIFRNFPNLEALVLRGGAVCAAEDMSDFASLTKLHELAIALDGLSSLRGLENLTALAELELAIYRDDSGNEVTDLSPMANLTQLRRLVLFVGGKSPLDLTPLSQLKNLTAVEISPGSRIVDRSPLDHVANVTVHN